MEYKTLGEIAVDIFRGTGIKREEVTAEGIPCVRYGEIYTTYGVWFDECVSHTVLENVPSPKYFEHGDILFAITGESVEDIAKSCAYIGSEKCLAGGDIVVLKHTQDPKYLAYALSTTEAQMQKSKGKVKSKVVHSSVPAIKEIIIPVPPLEVQREIVRILDNFTELTARKKQYEYYRDRLLTFQSDAKTYVLGDIATVTKLAGYEFTKYVVYSDTGNIIALRGLNVKNGKLDLTDVKYIDESDLSKLERSKLRVGDMLFTYVGTIGQVAVIDENDKYYLAPNVALIRCDQSFLLPEYMRYYFQSSQFWKTQINRLMQSSSMQNIPMEKIRQFELVVPSLDVQRRLVHVLDNFDAICSDLKIGLPAEIEARKKQYEFYRDALLTFAETGAIILDRQTDEYNALIKLCQYVFGYILLPMSDLFDLRNGFTPSKDNPEFWENGELPWFKLDDINDKGRVLSDSYLHITSKALKKSGLFPENSIIISTSATIGEYALITVPFLCNQRFTYMTVKSIYKEKVDVKYLMHYCSMLSKYCKEHLNQGNFASVDMKQFVKFEFTIPPLEEQKRIVTLLDRFDKLCNDISEGLPAEIEARQKQYEYYRDKLLTFTAKK